MLAHEGDVEGSVAELVCGVDEDLVLLEQEVNRLVILCPGSRVELRNCVVQGCHFSVIPIIDQSWLPLE